MTIPPDDKRSIGDSTNRQVDGSNAEKEETPVDLNHDTLPVPHSAKDTATRHRDDLPADLSPEERSRAAQALNFLDDVRAAASQESDRLPNAIGRYTIERSLGRGGFAEVFLAHDPQLDRNVALKVPLFNTAANDEVRLRFEREARLAATLGHPQIVPVYEYGNVGPLRYIAFALCNGPTLSKWSEDNKPIDFRTAAEIISHLADAVQHAHQRGIVHRDLKPGNVLVEESADGGEPVWRRLRIADFGLARSSEADVSVLTQDGRIVGTPAYMSPEQASSQSDVGPAADIWALGMMLFEILTGELPFRRDDLLATVRSITDDTVPRARSIRSEIPTGLDAIIDLCLRKSPSDRYTSAHELAEDLRRWLNGQPVQARPLSRVAKATMWMRRNPLPTASIAVTFAALGIGLSVALWQRNEAVANLREVQTQTSRADGNLQTAQTLISDIIALEKRLQSQGQLSEERSRLIRRAAKLQLELIEDEDQTSQVQYDTAVSLEQLSLLLAQLQQFDSSTETARRVLALLGAVNDDLPTGVSPAKLFEMRILQRTRIASNFSITNHADQAALEYAAAESEPIPAGVSPLARATLLSEMRRGKAVMLSMNGDNAGAVKEHKLALAYFANIDAPDDKKLRWNYFICKSRLHTGLGMNLTTLQNTELAAENFTQAAAALGELAEIFPDHPILAGQQMQLSHHHGVLAEQNSDWKTASQQYEASRKAALKLFNQNRENLMPANFYVMSSVALCRSHENSGAIKIAQTIARETFEAAKAFPPALRKDESFAGNINALKPLVRAAISGAE